MKKLIISVLAIFSVFAASALPFNSKLNDEDLKTLNEGKVLIKSIDYYKNMSIQGDNKAIKLIRETIDDLDPNYLAEVIQIKPYKGNEDLASKMRKALENIQDYVGIPYQASSGGWYDLYSTAEIKSTKQISDIRTLYESELFMEPFGTIIAPIEIEQTDDYIFYRMHNTNKMKYKGFTAVNANNLESCIILFRDGDNWILYGAGGVDAVWLPFIGSKIENSFIKRIKTFCNFIFTKF